MNTRLLILLTTLAFLGLSVSAFAGKPEKPGGGGPAPVYTAELTGIFSALSEDLTAKRKGKSLSGNYKLGVTHNDNELTNASGDPIKDASGDPIITGGIFGEDCWALLTASGVEAFDAPDDWGISYTRSDGGLQVHITMNDLIIHPGTSPNYSPVDFDLHLHGYIAAGKDFLPKSGDIEHSITKYMLWAGGKEKGWFICNSDGGGMDAWESLPTIGSTPNTLKITHITSK